MYSILDQIFKPLARLAIAKDMRFADVSDRLRRAFLDVAKAETGPKATVSQLSVTTGLQRRDVTRLLNDPSPQTKPRPDPLSKLVAQWLALNKGAPLPQHGDTNSFDALARSIRKDVHPRTLLDRLVSTGTAKITNGEVHLVKRAHIPLDGSDAQLKYLADNVGDHLATAVSNVLDEGTAFDLAVHYDGLTHHDVEALQTLWRARMAPVLEELNAAALERQGKADGTQRFRAGGYFRSENST